MTKFYSQQCNGVENWRRGQVAVMLGVTALIMQVVFVVAVLFFAFRKDTLQQFPTLCCKGIIMKA